MAEKLEILLTAKDEASGVLSKVGGLAKGLLAGGLGAAAGGVAALGSAVIASMGVTMSWAGTLDDVGDVLGTNAGQSAALAVAIKGVGGDVGQLTSQMAFMARGLTNAKGELGPTGLALQGLGINFRDANGNILPTTDILTAVADKLAVMPDGLQKTQLMMDVFGKSGKDLSDVMGSLTTEGFAAADEKAKALGLSMGESGVNSSIQLGRSFNDLKMMGQGLMVTLGSELMPVIQPLISQFITWAISVMPQVREGIKTVVQWVMTVFIPALNQLWSWVQTNIFPLLQTLANWLGTVLPPIIQTLSNFWTNTLLPAIREVWNWINTVLMPFFRDTVVPWLQEKIPAALQTLSDFWNKTLLPAINAVWSFLSTYIIPILTTLVDINIAALKLALGILAGLWDKLLLALTPVRDFIRDHIGPKLEWLKKEIIDPLASAIGTLTTGALKWLLDKLGELRDMLGKIKLPDWLTPGSATPLELGIRGIGQAVADLTRTSIPTLAYSLNPAMAGMGGGPVTNYYLTANYGYQSESSLADDVRMLAMLAR